MSTIAKCSCNICSGHIEFDASRDGETIACPHCGMDTILFMPQASLVKAPSPALPLAQPAAPAVQSTTILQVGLSAPATFARRRRGYRNTAGSIVLQIIGFLLLFLFPIGTVFGVILLVAGGQLARFWRCTNCGNPLADKHVQICPSCHSQILR